MKTVRTKINTRLYDELLDACNGSGCSISEKLRESIQNCIKNGSSYDRTESPPAKVENIRVISNGKTYDRFGKEVIYRDGQKPLVIIDDNKKEKGDSEFIIKMLELTPDS